MVLRDQRRAILNQVANGELTIETANRLLAALEAGIELPISKEESRMSSPSNLADHDNASNQTSPIEPIPAETPLEPPTVEPLRSVPDVFPSRSDEEMKERFARWQNLWVVPLSLGVLITVIGAYWLYEGWRLGGPGWRFWLAWIPFLAGLALIVIGYYTQSAPWLHVRVQEKKEGGHPVVDFAIPLPLGLASWGVTCFERFIPQEIRDKNLPEILATFENSITSEEPLHIFVDEDDEQVEISIFRPSA